MFGVRIIENPNLTRVVEDWSRVRSPARAARRRKKHRQNIAYRIEPMTDAFKLPDGSIVMHPEMAKLLRAKIKEKEDEVFSSSMNSNRGQQFNRGLYWGPIT